MHKSAVIRHGASNNFSTRIKHCCFKTLKWQRKVLFDFSFFAKRSSSKLEESIKPFSNLVTSFGQCMIWALAYCCSCYLFCRTKKEVSFFFLKKAKEVSVSFQIVIVFAKRLEMAIWKIQKPYAVKTILHPQTWINVLKLHLKLLRQPRKSFSSVEYQKYTCSPHKCKWRANLRIK